MSLCLFHATSLGDIVSPAEHGIAKAAHIVIAEIPILGQVGVVADVDPRVSNCLGLILLALLGGSLILGHLQRLLGDAISTRLIVGKPLLALLLSSILLALLGDLLFVELLLAVIILLVDFLNKSLLLFVIVSILDRRCGEGAKVLVKASWLSVHRHAAHRRGERIVLSGLGIGEVSEITALINLLEISKIRH